MDEPCVTFLDEVLFCIRQAHPGKCFKGCMFKTVLSYLKVACRAKAVLSGINLVPKAGQGTHSKVTLITCKGHL